MSFLAKLELDGNTYNILECNYSFSQSTDSTGKPQGMPEGGMINLRLESTGNPELLGWMLDHSKTKDGKIIYFRRDAMSKLQELNFEKAFCISFVERFNAESNEPLQIELQLVAQIFDVNGATHEKKWK